MFRIAICDDEKIVCSYIEKVVINYLNRIGQTVETVVFYSGESLCHFLSRNEEVDVVFLDIELGGIDGVSVGKKIRETLNNNTVQIVYISAKEAYAMELFKIRPFDFLIKPIKQDEIEQVIKKIVDLVGQLKQYFIYRKKGKMHKIAFKDILYFESNNRKINIITNNKIETFYGKLDDIARQVVDLKFLHIHKSYLVNYLYAVEIQYHKMMMANLKTLPISQSRRKEVRGFLLLFEKEKFDQCS